MDETHRSYIRSIKLIPTKIPAFLSVVTIVATFVMSGPSASAQTTAHFGVDPDVQCCYCIKYVLRSGCTGSITLTSPFYTICPNETIDIPLAAGEVIAGVKVYAAGCSTLLWQWDCSTGTSGSPTCGGSAVNFGGDSTTGFRIWP